MKTLRRKFSRFHLIFHPSRGKSFRNLNTSHTASAHGWRESEIENKKKSFGIKTRASEKTWMWTSEVSRGLRTWGKTQDLRGNFLCRSSHSPQTTLSCSFSHLHFNLSLHSWVLPLLLTPAHTFNISQMLYFNIDKNNTYVDGCGATSSSNSLCVCAHIFSNCHYKFSWLKMVYSGIAYLHP